MKNKYLILCILFVVMMGIGCTGSENKATNSQIQATPSTSSAANVTPTVTPVETKTNQVETKTYEEPMSSSAKVIYLHHSTGGVIWGGGVDTTIANYNTNHGTNYRITQMEFPKESPDGWNNYPYDYWNIWVNHAGASA